MTQRNLLSSAFALAVFSLSCLILVGFVEASENSVVSAEPDARLAIANAEQSIVVCYQAVADADRAGANTSTLLITLNEAGELLSEAKLAYEIADFDTALDYGLLTQAKLTTFVDEAEVLKRTAMQLHYVDFMINVVGLIIGTAVVICGGFVAWVVRKRRRGDINRDSPSHHEFSALFMIGTVILALLVASPALTRLLVHPRDVFFTELWILDSNRSTKDYPFNITLKNDYNVFLVIANRLGYCAYYSVEAKFRNQTQSAPNRFNHTSSSLPALFSIPAFVADEGIWEQSLSISFDYQYNESLMQVEFDNLTLNNVELSLKEHTTTWNAETNEFFSNLFFELWIYNGTTSSFQYHERFVSLRLNITV